MRGLDVVGKITSISAQPIATRKLAKAILKDDTGLITLNLWGPQADQCKIGDLVKVKDAYAKVHEGKIELNTWRDIEVLNR